MEQVPPPPSDEFSADQFSTEQGEQERARRGIWIVDDNKEHVDAILRWTQGKGDIGVDLKHYQEGEQAVSDFGWLAEHKGQKPDIILMDYNLAERVQDPKYRTGVEVIQELKKVADRWQIKLPEIIAFSSETSYAERLMGAGASSSIKKSDFRAISDLVDRFSG